MCPMFCYVFLSRKIFHGIYIYKYIKQTKDKFQKRNKTLRRGAKSSQKRKQPSTKGKKKKKKKKQPRAKQSLVFVGRRNNPGWVAKTIIAEPRLRYSHKLHGLKRNSWIPEFRKLPRRYAADRPRVRGEETDEAKQRRRQAEEEEEEREERRKEDEAKPIFAIGSGGKKVVARKKALLTVSLNKEKQ